MILARIPIDQLRPTAYNPRRDLQPSDREYQALKRSVDKWGSVEPLVWNRRSGNLVGGHQRLKILIERGDTDADVSVVDLDDADEKALNVALNKVGGGWDETKLFDLLADLDKDGMDITLTGFEPKALSDLAAGLEASAETPLFTPAEPQRELTYEPVTTAAVQAATTRAAERFQGPPPTVHEIVCPHCGKTFGG